MSVTTEDLRAKLVRSDLLDLESREFYLSNLWTDEGDAIAMGQSLDIGEITDTLAAQDAVNTSFVDQALTVSTISYGNNNLVINTSRAIAREIPSFDEAFTLGGGWTNKVTPHVLTKLKNDRDTVDFRYLLKNFVASTAYHVNIAGDPLQREMPGKAIARMMNTEGVNFQNLAWMQNSYMNESCALLPGWVINQEAPPNVIGVGKISKLNNVPVFVSQTVQQHYVDCVGVTVAGGNAVFAVPAANRPHGFLAGMKVWTSADSAGATWQNSAGDDIPEGTPVTVSEVAAGTITVPYAGTGATDAVAQIRVYTAAIPNLLVRRDWLWQSTHKRRFFTRVIPYGPTKVTDVLQAWSIWGTKSKAGAVQVLWTPKDVAVA